MGLGSSSSCYIILRTKTIGCEMLGVSRSLSEPCTADYFNNTITDKLGQTGQESQARPLN